jgi:transcriptional regulator with XRE-family HTH domain
MKTTLELIADLKAKHDLESDYAIAKLLGITKNAVSLYRNGKAYMGDEVALKVADLLDLDPAYVITCMHAEREKTQALKKIWSRIAKHYAVTATVVMAVTLTFVTLDSSIPSLPVLGDVSRSFDITKIMQSEIYIIRICQAFAAFIIAALCSTPKGRNDTTPA